MPVRVVGTLALLLAAGPLAASEPPPDVPTQDEVIERLVTYRPNRELRPEVSLFEPSKVFLLPHLLQGSSNSATGRQDQLKIEVEFNETFFPYQNPPSSTDRHFGGGIHKLGFTPMYRVRIWKEDSAPVRVPSFMPKLTLQWEYLARRERGLQWGQTHDRSGEVVTRAIGLHTAMLTVGHHSNGQDGCLFADAAGVGYPRERCPESPDPGTIRINRLNGSFSTNYVEASYFFRRISLPRKKDGSDDPRYVVDARIPGLWDGELRAHHAWLIGASYQYHLPFDSFGGALEKPVRPIYGMNRVRLTGSYEKYWVETGTAEARFFARLWRRLKETGFKVRAWTEITDKSRDTADCGPSGPLGGDAACAPQVGWGLDLTIGLFSKADGLGVYTRYMQAQDYYNLSFSQKKRDEFQVGLSFSLSRARGQAFPLINSQVLTSEPQDPDRWDDYRHNVAKAVKARQRSTPRSQP
jgi:hypothetical protein